MTTLINFWKTIILNILKIQLLYFSPRLVGDLVKRDELIEHELAVSIATREEFRSRNVIDPHEVWSNFPLKSFETLIFLTKKKFENVPKKVLKMF